MACEPLESCRTWFPPAFDGERVAAAEPHVLLHVWLPLHLLIQVCFCTDNGIYRDSEEAECRCLRHAQAFSDVGLDL